MNAKRFFDTNIVIYAFSKGDFRAPIAQGLLTTGGTVGVQTLNEFTAVMRRKLGRSWEDVFEALGAIRVLCPSPVPLQIETHERALLIASQHGYHIFDSLVIAAALEAGCGTLYSEDLHDGQVIDGLTIRNPFVPQATPPQESSLPG
jgi:predicted nucleic acid-binding protein